jgi:hypothetical protein
MFHVKRARKPVDRRSAFQAVRHGQRGEGPSSAILGHLNAYCRGARMTAPFEDLPLAEMVKALDAKLDSMPGSLGSVIEGRRGDPDTVARARQQLALAEAEARRHAAAADRELEDEGNKLERLRNPARPTTNAEIREAIFNAVLGEMREIFSSPNVRLAIGEAIFSAVLGEMRETFSSPNVRLALKAAVMGNPPAYVQQQPPALRPSTRAQEAQDDEAVKPPWEALGLARDVWARLNKAGKLKED